jgi:hypothetical protein
MKILHSLAAALLSATSLLARRVAFPLLFLGAGLVLVQPCAADSGVFNNTGSLSTARYQHTATLLPNGKVLVAAGSDSSFNPSASAELYDPASGTWTATGSLGTARAVHTATLLPNGKVLVAGGTVSNDALASAELYDPVSGTWTVTGSLTNKRLAQTATLLPNGKVLVPGGYNYTSGALARRGTLRGAANTANLAQHFHPHARPYRRPSADRWLYHHRNRPKEGLDSRAGSVAQWCWRYFV